MESLLQLEVFRRVRDTSPTQIGFYSLFVACLVVRNVPIMFAGMLARSSWRISAVITCMWQVEFVLQSEVFDMLAVSFRSVLTLVSWTVYEPT